MYDGRSTIGQILRVAVGHAGIQNEDCIKLPNRQSSVAPTLPSSRSFEIEQIISGRLPTQTSKPKDAPAELESCRLCSVSFQLQQRSFLRQ
jgi:hypothetical protein